MSAEDSRRGVGPVGAALLCAMARRHVRASDPERPEVVELNRRSRAVLECAQRLAGEGRSDPGAVAEITEVARSKEKVLAQALRASQFAGRHLELADPNLTYRLLRAAVDRSEVAALGPDETGVIAAVAAFHALALDARWTFLVDRQPALRALEADALAGDYGALEFDPQANREQLLADGRRTSELDRRLQDLVGPTAASDEPVIGSYSAYEAAVDHVRIAVNEQRTDPA